MVLRQKLPSLHDVGLLSLHDISSVFTLCRVKSKHLKIQMRIRLSSYTLKRASSCNMHLLVDFAVLVAFIAPFPSLTKGEKAINTRSMVCKLYALQIALCSLTYSSSFVVLLITVKLHGNPTGKSKTFSVFSNSFRAS